MPPSDLIRGSILEAARLRPIWIAGPSVAMTRGFNVIAVCQPHPQLSSPGLIRRFTIATTVTTPPLAHNRTAVAQALNDNGRWLKALQRWHCDNMTAMRFRGLTGCGAPR